MRKRTALMLVGAAAALTVVAGTAIAGHIGSEVTSYTGCLSTGGGTLTQINPGSEPLGGACGKSQVEAHFSGGDITAITAQAGGGLTGGGTNGAASLSIRRDCGDGQMLKWNGSTSSWACATDSDSAYTEGTGLDLNGSVFSIEPEYRVKNTSDCESGTFATGFDSAGAIACAAPPAASGIQGFSAHVGHVTLAGVTTVVSKVLPAGRYLLFASVDVVNRDTDSVSLFACGMPGYQSPGTGPSDVAHTLGESDGGRIESVSMASAITHPGGAVALQCQELVADVDVSQATLTAIKVDSLG